MSEPGKNSFDYTIREGDNLSKIAEKYYGNEKANLPIASHNKLDKDGTLEIGQSIWLPQTLCYRESNPAEHIVQVRSANVDLLDKPIPFFRSAPESPGHYSRVSKSVTAIADDMTFGDYSVDRYRSINAVCWADPLLLEPEDLLFVEMTTMCAGLFTGPSLLPTVLDVIGKFRNNKGPAGLAAYNTLLDAYSDPALTSAAINHHSTKEFIAQAQKEAVQAIVDNKLDVRKVPTKWLDKKPIFHDPSDIALGLTILINDTWAYEVDLAEYKILDARRFQGKLKIKVYDHFGLDQPDLDIKLWEQDSQNHLHFKLKPYGLLAGFRAWFILQHIKGYRPFWTVFETTAEVEGSL